VSETLEQAHFDELEGKLREANRVIDAAGALSDWVNRAKPAIRELLMAYQRRIRSDCTTPEQLTAEPWRCSEYIVAEAILNEDAWGLCASLINHPWSNRNDAWQTKAHAH